MIVTRPMISSETALRLVQGAVYGDHPALGKAAEDDVFGQNACGKFSSDQPADALAALFNAVDVYAGMGF